jgi:hypothetical protein
MKTAVDDYLKQADEVHDVQAAATTPPTGAARARFKAPSGGRYVLDRRVSNSGGIESVEVEITGRNQVQVTIDGEIKPQIDRMGFEDKLPSPGQIDDLRGLDYDRAHLWGRQFGDEAAEGVMYAPKKFNTGLQKTLEAQIRELRRGLRPGERLVLRARATSYPRTQYGGATLNKVEYDFAFVDAAGTARDRVGLVFEIEPPTASGTRWSDPRVVPGGLPWGGSR